MNGCELQNTCESNQIECPNPEFDSRGCRVHPTVQCRDGQDYCPEAYDERGENDSKGCDPLKFR